MLILLKYQIEILKLYHEFNNRIFLRNKYESKK